MYYSSSIALGNMRVASTSSQEKEAGDPILSRAASPMHSKQSKASTLVARLRRRNIIWWAAVALFFTIVLVVVLVLIVSVSSSLRRHQDSRPSEAALRALSTLSTGLPPPTSSSEQEPRREQRLPPPSASATVIAAALSLAANGDNDDSRKTDADFLLAVPRAPLLTAAELLTLQHYARGSSYVEWGSGASTALAAPMARRAVSIENQKPWCDEMLASPDIDFWIKDGVLTYLCVDTGPTGAFGRPTAEASPENFGRYLSALDDAAAAVALSAEDFDEGRKDNFLPSKMKNSSSKDNEDSSSSSSSSSNSSSSSSSSLATTATASTNTSTTSSSTNAFTVVLVDGRFRVACALKALWHIDHSRGVLLVHDWTLRKEQYHAPILKRYRLVTVIDRLAVLVPSSPQAQEDLASGNKERGDETDQEAARIRWWSEAAAELQRFSSDPA